MANNPWADNATRNYARHIDHLASNHAGLRFNSGRCSRKIKKILKAEFHSAMVDLLLDADRVYRNIEARRDD